MTSLLQIGAAIQSDQSSAAGHVWAQPAPVHMPAHVPAHVPVHLVYPPPAHHPHFSHVQHGLAPYPPRCSWSHLARGSGKEEWHDPHVARFVIYYRFNIAPVKERCPKIGLPFKKSNDRNSNAASFAQPPVFGAWATSRAALPLYLGTS